MTTGLEDVGRTVASVVDRVGPATVGLGRGWGRGSGVVIGPGRVATCAHALRGDGATVTFADGRQEPGRVTAADPDLDLAVLDVATADTAPVAWAEGALPTIGAPVVALGNPGGRGLRATPGFVSAANRTFRGPRGRARVEAIEHTAPLPRGASGGPLVDLEGRLLGWNALRLDGGLILAVAAAPVCARVEALAAGEVPDRVSLGVAVVPPRVARRMRRAVGMDPREGLLVRAVESGGPADAAGLARGDLIVDAAGSPVTGLDVLYAALDAVAPGGELRLGVVRGSDEREVVVRFPGAES